MWECARAGGLLQCAVWKAVARQMEADGRRLELTMVGYLIATTLVRCRCFLPIKVDVGRTWVPAHVGVDGTQVVAVGVALGYVRWEGT